MEGSANTHGFADTLHRGGQNCFRARELFKGETRYLGYHVVESGLEGCRSIAGNIVFQFVEGVTDGEFRGDFGNGITGGLGGECGRAGDAGIHFNDDHPSCLRTNGKLDVGATCFHPDFPNDGKGGIAHPLILSIRKSLGRSDGDTVACMDSHWIKVFNGADNDAVVRVISHDLHFVLFPAEKGFLHEDFRGGGGVET